MSKDNRARLLLPHDVGSSGRSLPRVPLGGIDMREP